METSATSCGLGHEASPTGLLESFLPRHRRRAIAEGRDIPDRVEGAGLFADISGFTPLTEALVAEFGTQRGAEELNRNLNRIYEAIVDDLAASNGEVLYFSGDAITCWLDGDDGSLALRAAVAMQETLRSVGTIETSAGQVSLSIKVAVVAGRARRIVVGDPEVQLLDVLGGRLIDHLAAAEGLAEKGDIIADESVLDALGDRVVCGDYRTDPDVGRRCGVVRSFVDDGTPVEIPPLARLTAEQLKPWLWPFVHERLVSGGGDFLSELRTVHPIFVRFGGFDFDDDPDVAVEVDRFIRAVQAVLDRYQGTLLGITVGDKGAYLNGALGTPWSHEDDARRAVSAAIEIRDLEATTAVSGVQVGVSVGRVFSGTYGHSERRTMSVLGDPTNLAARLMSKAPPGEVYVYGPVAEATADHFVWQDLPPLTLKGKAAAVEAKVAVVARRRPVRRAQRYELPMVGRDRELAQVRAHLQATLAGDQSVVGIGAEAGIGKSRFVAEVVKEARADGLVVAYGQAESLGRNSSYTAWREPWRTLFGLDDDRPDEEQVRSLERVLRSIDPALVPRLPVLGPVVGLDIPDNELVATFDAKLRKTSAENLLADVLVHRLRESPTLVVLEDVQWVDPLSVDLLVTLLRRTRGLPAMFFFSYRYEGAEARPDQLAELADHDEVVLHDLDEDGMRQVVAAKAEQVFGEGTVVSDELLDVVLGRAQGNPFYAEELVNYVRRNDLDPADPASLGQLDLPESLQAIVLSRIDALDEHPRQAVKVASIFGREFESELLGRVHGQLGDLDQVLDHLERSQAVDLVAPVDVDLEEWLFRHAITRDVAYDAIPFGIRAPLHERIGDLLATRGSGGAILDLLAHHYWHSENDDKKRRHLRLAGDAARDAYANSAATEHYQRLAQIADDDERAGVLLDLAGVLELVGDWDNAGAAADEARVLATAAGDDVRVGWCDVQLGELARRRGDFDEADSILRQARLTFKEHGEEAGEARVGHLRGTVAAQQGNLVEARRHYERSRSIRNRSGDVIGLSAVLTNLGIVSEYEGDLVECRSFHERALELRRATTDRWALANSYTNLGMVAMYEADHEDALERFSEAMRLNAEIGDTWSIGLAHHNLANAHRELGDADVARGLYAEALATFRDYADRWALAFLLEDIARLAVAEDRPLALALLGAADRLREELDVARPEALEQEVADALEPHLDGVDAEERLAARAKGRATDEDASLDLAERYCAAER